MAETSSHTADVSLPCVKATVLILNQGSTLAGYSTGVPNTRIILVGIETRLNPLLARILKGDVLLLEKYWEICILVLVGFKFRTRMRMSL